jgi:hypothetical protein
VSDARTPADIEADIIRRREELAASLDEIAVRVHPKTIMADAKARVAATVDRTAGRAYVAVNAKVSGARASMVDEKGAPRLERCPRAAAAADAPAPGPGRPLRGG